MEMIASFVSLPGMLPTGEPGVPIAGAPTDEADSVTKAFIGGGLSAAYSKLSKGEGEEGEEGELGEGGDEKKEEDLQNFDFVPRRKTKKHWQSLVASGVHVAPVIGRQRAAQWWDRRGISASLFALLPCRHQCSHFTAVVPDYWR